MSETPTIVPMLTYEDAEKAIDFLCGAFGFTERSRIRMDDGRIGHAELTLGDGTVMLAEVCDGYQSPNRLAESYEPARQWLDTPYLVNGVYVQVDDVRAHFERASSAGARILSEVEDAGHGVIYRAADPEGQRWMFSQSSR